MRDHENVQLPGPPRARLMLGAVVMLIGGLVLLGVVPFGLMTFGVVLVLVGAGTGVSDMSQSVARLGPSCLGE